jgi:hypothetical protein
MPILGKLLQKGIKIRETLEQEYSHAQDLQKNELKKLLITARETEFGKAHNFKEILRSFKSGHTDEFYRIFQKNVPVFNYNSIYEKWWHRTRSGEPNICWPGKVKYFALSSGTSETSSKYIPVTKDIIKSIQKTSIRQILTLSRYELSPEMFTKGILMLGGSTHLNYNGTYFEGDLSGITASQIPFWFQHFYKPGKKISKTTDWSKKLDEIAKKAPDWNIGVIVGVPAWIQILMEKIIDRYKVQNIHEIWPNLSIYVHGGVSFDPYRKGFEKLLGKPIYYIETYLASEGFIAFQALPNRSSMRMVLNNGLFYEFIPFNDKNFNEDGELKPNAELYRFDQIEENVNYALLLTTCAGTWRYMIGDTIKLVSKEENEIVITGRTKHFLSLCGEHLSVENMNKAIRQVEEDLNIDIKEFTVAGIHYQNLFAHHWYIGTDNQVDKEVIKNKLDEKLKELNDDYRVERSAALKEIFVDLLPTQVFYNWMRLKGKEGGQNKFPRVFKDEKLKDWRSFLQQEKLI